MAHGFLRLLAGAAMTLALQAVAIAESRLALVIGNSNYASIPSLPTPANDAKAFAELLTTAGFQMIWGVDVGQADMRRAVRDFSAAVASRGPDTVALVFFAGHGVQVDGENYLIPVDARIERETDVTFEALRLDDVLNALAATSSKARIVVVDASRLNPFAQFRSTSGRGLAITESPAASLIVYSAGPGSEAPTSAGPNSPFAAALIAASRTPGLTFEESLKIVRGVVHGATEGRQVPWEDSKLTIGFSLFAGAQPPAAPGPRLKPPGFWQQQLQSRTPVDAFELVLSENAIDGYQAFLVLFPQPPFGPHVRSLLDRRREMAAWQNALTLNSAASYEAFLTPFAGSDLAPTARRLLARARARSATPDLLAATINVLAAPGQAGFTTAAAPPGQQAAPSQENAKPRRKPSRSRATRASESSATASQPAAAAAPSQPAQSPISVNVPGVNIPGLNVQGGNLGVNVQGGNVGVNVGR